MTPSAGKQVYQTTQLLLKSLMLILCFIVCTLVCSARTQLKGHSLLTVIKIRCARPASAHTRQLQVGGDAQEYSAHRKIALLSSAQCFLQLL